MLTQPFAGNPIGEKRHEVGETCACEKLGGRRPYFAPDQPIRQIGELARQLRLDLLQPSQGLYLARGRRRSPHLLLPIPNRSTSSWITRERSHSRFGQP